MTTNYILLTGLAGCFLLGPMGLGAQETETSIRVQGSQPDSTQVELLIFDAEVAWRDGNPMRAIHQLRQALALDPDRLEAHTELARILTTIALEAQAENLAQVARDAIEHWDFVLEREPGLKEGLDAKRELARRFSEGSLGLRTNRGRLALERGQRAMEEERYADAAEGFREVLRAEPRALGIHRLLADALSGLQQWEGAENAYRKSLALNDQDAMAYLGLARSLEAQGEVEEAERRYLESFELNPESPEASGEVVRILRDRTAGEFEVEDRVTVGRALMRERELRRALVFLKSAVEEYAPPIYRKYLGIAYYFNNDAKNAIDQLAVAFEHLHQDLELTYYLGASYLAMDDQARGRALLGEVLQQDPRNPNALKLLGANLAEEPGLEEDAERMLRAAVRFGANIPELPCILGGLALRRGLEDKADSLMRRCVEVRPDHAPTHLSLAILADNNQEYGRAIIHLEKYLQLNPDQPGALMRSAIAYFRLARDQEAFEKLRRITELDEAFSPPPGTEADEPFLLEMAVFFMSTVRNYEDATWLGERLLTLNTENSIYNNNLAMNYADANIEMERAYDLAVRANELSPDDPGHLDTLGWVLVRLARYSEAESTLMHSIDLAEKAGMTNLGEIYYHLAVLYLETERSEDAQRWLRKATESQLPPGVRRQVDALLKKTP